MFLTRSEYDRGVNTFSPEGRLFQVEYAIEAIKIGTTAIGIATAEGVVIAVEKRLLSPLQEPSSVEKLFEVDSHIGVAMSGLSADARTLVDHARSESQYHRFTYNEPMPCESLTQSVCDLALGFGESEGSKMARPFGVALLVAGWDSKGPVLYHTDPSGTYTRFDAKAIGAGSEGAQTALQEQYHQKLSLAEAETMAVTILKQVMEDKVDVTNVEARSGEIRGEIWGDMGGRDQRRGPPPPRLRRGSRGAGPAPLLSHSSARGAPGRLRLDAGRGGGAAGRGRMPLRPRRRLPPAVHHLRQGATRGGARPRQRRRHNLLRLAAR